MDRFVCFVCFVVILMFDFMAYYVDKRPFDARSVCNRSQSMNQIKKKKNNNNNNIFFIKLPILTPIRIFPIPLTRKEMFYFTTHSTHFIYDYMASDIIMVKDHSDRERGNPLPPHRLLFPISSKGSFICIVPHTG